MRLYILNVQGTPVLEPDLMAWGLWMGCKERIVSRDTVNDSSVSTVFLGLDHNYGAGPPILWETMVFGGPLDQEQDRCSGSREQAEAMHAKMVAKVRAVSHQKQ
jgi:hypothetical protein